MMKTKLLIINKTQFGYHTDYYKYCEYLRDEFEVTYLCFDSGLKKLKIGDVNVKYISNKGNRAIRGLRFFVYIVFEILKFHGIIFIHYFEGCQKLKQLMPFKKMMLDIRTLSINIDKKLRKEIGRA